MSTDVRPTARSGAAIEPTTAENWALVAAGTVLVTGVFSDGWAHTNVLDELEGFITPWHLVIFAGFLACLTVITRASLRRVSAGVPIWSAAPRTWWPAVWGIALFALGFLGDGVWHTIFGIEADFEALMSPTHLMMLTGGLAVLSGPIASTPRRPDARLGPVLASMTLFMALVSFFLVWVWPPYRGLATAGYQEFVDRQLLSSQDVLRAFGEINGVAGYLLFTIATVGPILYLGRRWKLPTGSLLLITMVPWLGLMLSFLGNDGRDRIPAMLVAVVVGEFILRFAGPDRRRVLMLFAAVVPAVWVAGDLLAVQLFYGIGWAPELVAGSVALAALMGSGIGLLATRSD